MMVRREDLAGARKIFHTRSDETRTVIVTDLDAPKAQVMPVAPKQ
jgi:hypothetical protein